METGSKSASKHSKTLFFVNIKSISIKEVNLSTKGHRHILKGQSKNVKLLKKTPLKQYWGTLLKPDLKHLQNIELNLLPLLEHQSKNIHPATKTEIYVLHHWYYLSPITFMTI